MRSIRGWGPHHIGYHLHLPPSTESEVIARYRMPLVGHIDLNTGLTIRMPRLVRYEHANPGELVHIDAKKLGRIPDGGLENPGRNSQQDEPASLCPDRIRLPSLHHR
ncbi:hypothetical protein GCM10007382_19520 [Salinibacterium xinjiangense]|uniref:hypothetical protein n=1 Tax=Salinibacterium xinjiangense TaxID=386302 RepID=UPI001179EBF2|nr:hypothetical protein [Salinibacterium xinjiangense]GGK99603.1 hypothetical protein GCM10007382_19520 [Salinibacterium xinjiangense]